ncbi:MAG: FHA domain-containing protein [Armatimonadetes bacterium]|nr:FHA domain-containing protein [Armatimonadota bacterium]
MELGLLLTIGKYLFVALLYVFIAVVFRLLIVHIATAQRPVVQHGGQPVQRPVLERASGQPPQEPSRTELEAKEATAEPPQVARLFVVETSATNLSAGTCFPLSKSISIGRKSHNDISLQDRYVSATHTLIVQQDDSFILRDYHSTNGTVHNGHRIQDDVALSDGDEITIGTTTLRYQH